MGTPGTVPASLQFLIHAKTVLGVPVGMTNR